MVMYQAMQFRGGRQTKKLSSHLTSLPGVGDDQVKNHSSIHNCDTNTSDTNSKLLVFEKSTSKKYLTDTGADISVVPPKPKEKNKHGNTIIPLYAANGTKTTQIGVYGEKRIAIDLDLRRDFTWNFVLADVSQPIIGYDFLSHSDLLVDCKRSRLIDNTTGLHTIGKTQRGTKETEIKTIDYSHQFANLLSEFPSITSMEKLPINSSVFHHIETKRPPVYCRPRRLESTKLDAAKKNLNI